jgi:nucleotide-binding universal stress UspA family protein
MKSLLLATNLGTSSRHALERALLLARRQNAQLHVVHVTGEANGAGADVSRHVQDAIERLEHDLEDEFGAGFAPASVQEVAGSVPDAIARAAAAVNAELLIAGLPENSGRSLDGTILEQLLLHASRPLIVVKTKPTSAYERVLVGLDLAPTSFHVLETALRVAPTANFTIVHAAAGNATSEELREQINGVAQQCVAASSRKVGFHEGAVEIRIENGAVGELMKQCAEQFDPHLVAFAKHNRGSSASPYLGSGARAILESLDADMLVTTSAD